MFSGAFALSNDQLLEELPPIELESGVRHANLFFDNFVIGANFLRLSRFLLEEICFFNFKLEVFSMGTSKRDCFFYDVFLLMSKSS